MGRRQSSRLNSAFAAGRDRLVAGGLRLLVRAAVAGGAPFGKSAGRTTRCAPYQVNGVWYYPKVNYSYDETGTASWYGPAFDGKATADGEIYDLNQMTAAHKTLPLPSVVEVSNLQNGRAVGCASTIAARSSGTG